MADWFLVVEETYRPRQYGFKRGMLLRLRLHGPHARGPSHVPSKPRRAQRCAFGPRVRMPHSTPPKAQSGESHTHRLAGWALAERVQSSGQLGAKVVIWLQQGGVTPHLGLALVLLGVRLRCVVEPLDPLLVAAREELPARIRVEAVLWCLLLLPTGNGAGVAGQEKNSNSGPTGPRTSVGAVGDAADSRPRPRPPPRPRPRATVALSPRAIATRAARDAICRWL